MRFIRWKYALWPQVTISRKRQPLSDRRFMGNHMCEAVRNRETTHSVLEAKNRGFAYTSPNQREPEDYPGEPTCFEKLPSRL
jgi:hypothetical protein